MTHHHDPAHKCCCDGMEQCQPNGSNQPAMPEIVRFDQVSFAYERNPVLEQISFSINERDFMAIIGPNGGGKTTILKLMLGIITPQQGTIAIFGGRPHQALHRIGYVPQYAQFDKEFPVTVSDVVLLGGMKKYSLLPFFSKAEHEKAAAAMHAVDVASLKNTKFGSLSGGQKQRVLIARALVSDPQILLLDEPVASVDSRIEQDIYSLLQELNKKITIIMVSHDIGFVSNYVNKIACVNRSLVFHLTGSMHNTEIEKIYHANIHQVNHQCGI